DTARRARATLSLHDALPISGNFERSLERDEAVLAWLDRTAVRILNGEPAQHPDELRAEMQAVTPATARDAMAQAVRSAIYVGPGDRKSTRLNSSHRTISYAV